jgi:hypothetical protein
MSRNQVEGYFDLGRWVRDIRLRKNDLNKSQVAKLDIVDGWHWTLVAPRTRSDGTYDFESGLRLLKKYVSQHGNSRVPQMVTGDTSVLGLWVKSTRRRFHDGSLSNEQIATMITEPGWTWSEQDARYRDYAEDYRAFVLDGGPLRVPKNVLARNGKSLGTWVSAQRRYLRDGALTDERQRLLASVPGWPSN